MKSILSVLILMLGVSGFAQTKNSKVAPAPRMTLFNAETVLKMNDLQRERYLEALRDYMDEVQAKDPTFAQYLMDTLLGSSVAEAVDVFGNPEWKKTAETCRSGYSSFFSNTGRIVDPKCVAIFEEDLKSGYFKDCKTISNNGKSVSIQCTEMSTTEGKPKNFDIAKSALGDTEVESKKLAELQAQSRNGGSNGTGGAAVDPSKGYSAPSDDGKKPAADGKKAEEQKKSEKADEPKTADKPARCFYGGFLIRVEEGDKKKNKCEPVSDYCNENNRIPSWTAQVKELAICKTNGGKGGKCPNPSAESSTIKKGGDKNKKEDVLCNPMLYGTDLKDGKEQVICVARGAKASESCRDKAMEIEKKDKEAFKKRLIAQLTGNKRGFDEFSKGLAGNCNYRFSVSYNAEQGSLKKMEDVKDETIEESLKKNEAAGGWTKNTGRADMKKTCQTLLKRLAEVGFSSGDDKIKGEIKKTLQSTPEGGTK